MINKASTEQKLEFTIITFMLRLWVNIIKAIQILPKKFFLSHFDKTFFPIISFRYNG